MKRFLFSVILLIIAQISFAQELNISVQVITNQVQNVDKKVFETMRLGITEFMNNTKWTNDVYKNTEKLDATILINISKAISQTEFEASIQVESTRPVYKASYTTTLLNYNDQNFKFKYVEFQPFEFNENSYTNNLTSVLAFYAYMIIGFDYDSFSLNGGLPYFQKAQTVVNNAQNGGESGWKAFEDRRNRYWMVEQTLNPAYKPLREAFYKYHLQGLDMMHKDPDKGKNAILESLELIKKVYTDFPTLFIMQIFFNAKSAELINIFSQGSSEEKQKAFELLSKIDPANTNKYSKIVSGK